MGPRRASDPACWVGACVSPDKRRRFGCGVGGGRGGGGGVFRELSPSLVQGPGFLGSLTHHSLSFLFQMSPRRDNPETTLTRRSVTGRLWPGLVTFSLCLLSTCYVPFRAVPQGT